MKYMRATLAFPLVMILFGCAIQNDWYSAQRTDTIASYTAFLDKYPAGRYSDRARAGIRKINEIGLESLLTECSSGNVDKVGWILDRRPDLLNKADKDGFSPLLATVGISAYHGDTHFLMPYDKVVQLLLERGADVNASVKNGYTVLHLIAWYQYPNKGKWSLQINGKPGSVHFHNMQMASLKRILERGANPNAIADDGKTPIAVAIENGNNDMVTLLQEYGAKK